MTDGLDVSRLSPSDAATSFRSFARRYRGLFTGFEDDESPDALLNRPGTDGRSAAQLARVAARDLEAAGEALRVILVTDTPAVSTRANGLAAAAGTPQEALDAVTGAATALADRIDATDPGDWKRRATVDGRDRSALDVVRDAVRAASDGYRATERAVEEARRALR